MDAHQDEQSINIAWYFADPMCSWCWGFSPVIDAIKAQFGNQLKIGLILGGLRPGTTEPVTLEFREEIFQHWRHVHDLSGQLFSFDGALPDGFVYDTEPPSRAVVAVGEIQADRVLDYFKSIQHAFYVEQKDVTNETVLRELAQTIHIDEQQFLQHFRAHTTREKTRAHFYRARQFGVSGFPTIILDRNGNPVLLTAGYRPYAALKPHIENWLDKY